MTVWEKDAPVRRRLAKQVSAFDEQLHSQLDDMAVVMGRNGCVGLAAPRIGVSQRVILVDLPQKEREEREKFEMINPAIILLPFLTVALGWSRLCLVVLTVFAPILMLRKPVGSEIEYRI